MENLAQHSSQVGVTGITEKLKGSLSSLIQSSEELKQALITRDVDEIWKILAFQEEQLAEFQQQNFLWNQLFGDISTTDPAIAKVKENLHSEMKHLKTIGQSNGSLAKSFLTAIRSAMKVTGSKIAGKTNIYGRRGRMKLKKSSLMLNRVG